MTHVLSRSTTPDPTQWKFRDAFGEEWVERWLQAHSLSPGSRGGPRPSLPSFKFLSCEASWRWWRLMTYSDIKVTLNSITAVPAGGVSQTQLYIKGRNEDSLALMCLPAVVTKSRGNDCFSLFSRWLQLKIGVTRQWEDVDVFSFSKFWMSSCITTFMPSFPTIDHLHHVTSHIALFEWLNLKSAKAHLVWFL